MIAAVLAVLLGGAPGWEQLDDGGRARAIEGLKAVEWPARLARATDRFLGTPYRPSPLGEGAGPDADPLLRFDAVDCLTMVEEALALGHAGSPGELVHWLNRIRYRDGEAAWERRRHVMEAQWLPDNVASGLLVDVTRQWGGARTRRVKKTLSEATWAGKMGQGLNLPPPARPGGDFYLDIIPPAVAVESLRQAPDGLILVVVRADRPQAVTRVVHLGVLVQGSAGPMLRHASRSFKRVVDEPLERYLARNLAFAPWTVEGLAVFEPRP